MFTSVLTRKYQRWTVTARNIGHSRAIRILHDSPGFEIDDEKLLQGVLLFMEKNAKVTDVDDQLHAIWSVSLSWCTYWPLIVSSAVKGFVLFFTMLGVYFFTVKGVL
jgi:hypothetical protein